MNKPTLDASLEQVRVRFDQWRSAGSGSGRIPDDLWAAAVELARHAGVKQTAQLLHLDGGKLKRQLMAADAGESAGAAPAIFVELVASADWLVGVHHRDGTSAGRQDANRTEGSVDAGVSRAEPCVANAAVIQIAPQMRVLVAIEPVDGRKGIDSLARLCQEKLAVQPN